MPAFCRHNRLIQNCPICSREQQLESRPIVSSRGTGSSRRSGSSRPSSSSRGARGASPATRRPGERRTLTGGGRASQPHSSGTLTVRRVPRGMDDGYRSQLVRGLKSSVEAESLAGELSFAALRLRRLEEDPPGLYAQVADRDGSLEERTWLAFLIAYLCPLDGDDPFAAIAGARCPWDSGRQPRLEKVQTGPRMAHHTEQGLRTLDAYKGWADRAGSQAAAFHGESSWSAERRFARLFERLALPGLHRDARFDLLVTLGRLGVYELRADALKLGGTDTVTVGAKRAFGIGDPLLLERRASELAEACGLPLESLDVALYNWERGKRATLGMGAEIQDDDAPLGNIRTALGM